MVKLIDVSTPKHPDTFAIVDDEDYERVMDGPKWICNTQQDGRPYVVRTVCPSRGVMQKQSLHRFLINAPDEKHVDHKNGNGLDNRRENLRLCSHEGNMRNKGISCTNTSGYKGIVYIRRINRWRAHIRIGEGRRLDLGCYKTKEEAAAVYDKAALKYHGEFARTNAMIREEQGDHGDPPDDK